MLQSLFFLWMPRKDSENGLREWGCQSGAANWLQWRANRNVASGLFSHAPFHHYCAEFRLWRPERSEWGLRVYKEVVVKVSNLERYLAKPRKYSFCSVRMVSYCWLDHGYNPRETFSEYSRPSLIQIPLSVQIQRQRVACMHHNRDVNFFCSCVLYSLS